MSGSSHNRIWTVVVVVCSLLITSGVHASSWTWGAKAGPTWGGISGKTALGWRPAAGVSGGLFLTTSLQEKNFMRFEVSFGLKRARRGFLPYWSNRYSTGEHTLDLYYLDVNAVLFGLRFPSSVSPIPFVGVGSFFAAKLDSREKQELRLIDDWSEIITLRGDPLEKDIDYGLSIVGGLEFPMNKGVFLMEIRYSHGLAAIFDSYGEAVRTRSIACTVGLGFGR